MTVNLPQASIRAPLSSSTATSCPFPILGKVLMLTAPAAMPLEITVETPAPCKTDYRSHSLVVIVTRTLRKYNANLPCAVEPFWVILGTAAHILVAHSRRFPLSALQRGYCRAVHCIQGSVFVPCVHQRQIRGNRESRVGSRGFWVKGTVGHSVPIYLYCVYIRRGLRVKHWGTHPHQARSAHCIVLSGREGSEFSGAPHFQQPKQRNPTPLDYKYRLTIVSLIWYFQHFNIHCLVRGILWRMLLQWEFTLIYTL